MSGRANTRRRALSACALAALLAAPPCARAFADELAMQSDRAAQALLLHVARAGPRIVGVGEWGHVVLSDDGGRSWRQAKSVPTRVTLTGLFFVGARLGWAVGHDGVILHTADGGDVWELQREAREDETPLLSVWFENATRGLAVGAFGLALETRDAGKSWRRVAGIGSGEEDRHLNQIFAGPEGTLFIAAEYGTVYRSDDRGRSWRDLHPPYSGSFWGGLTTSQGAVLVFGMRGHVFRTEDLGATWVAIRSGTEQSLGGATELADGRIVIVGLGGAVLFSDDGGKTFAATTRPDRRGIAAVAAGADGQILLFGETGVQTGSDGRPSARAEAAQPRAPGP
ncbi:MAG: hypothetical protein JSU66_12515 [Deltaproteobacteria bacterium]|nr:MAG: hypothetical protein JSU66_12515 [Deltaproteobacteria bacterium]